MTDLKGYALDITPNNDLYMIASIKDDEILMYEALKKDIKSKKSIEKTNLKMNTKNDIPSFFCSLRHTTVWFMSLLEDEMWYYIDTI